MRIGRRGRHEIGIHPEAAQNVIGISVIGNLHPARMEGGRTGQSQSEVGGGDAHGRNLVGHGYSTGLHSLQYLRDGLRGGAPGHRDGVAGNPQQPRGGIDEGGDGRKQRIQLRRARDAVEARQVRVANGAKRLIGRGRRAHGCCDMPLVRTNRYVVFGCQWPQRGDFKQRIVAARGAAHAHRVMHARNKRGAARRIEHEHVFAPLGRQRIEGDEAGRVDRGIERRGDRRNGRKPIESIDRRRQRRRDPDRNRQC